MRIGVHFWLALVFCSAVGPVGARERLLPLAPCRLTSEWTGGSVAARCGEYRVAERRDDPQGTALSLHVAIVAALRLQPAADPLFILSGGPGQAASDFYLSAGAAFARIRRDRDIVLVDQRGTGKSHRLDCPFAQHADVAVMEPQKLKGLVRACLAALPGDVAHYTTSVAVRDLDEVRAALGYEAINLYGISYGTRVAQHYMRRHPQRVRTAILDGVVPAELALGPDVALDAQRAVDNAFTRCTGDEQCARQFPGLAGQFAALQARLSKEPAVVSIADPITGKLRTATLDAARLGAAVRLLSYTDETLSTLPLLIHEAQTLREPHALAAQYLLIERSMGEQIAAAMHFTVVCSEDAPRWHEHPVSEETLARTYIGTAFMNGMRAVCEEWPRGPVDADFAAPLASAVPTLLLSGGNDPVTPQRYAERVLRSLRNARHLVVAGQGHGQITNACIARLAAQFVAEGSAAALDEECVRRVAPAPFMLSRTASAP